MRTIVVIPARYNSKRFPGKPLVNLLGRPMISWVADSAARAVGRENVYVATEDPRIEEFVKSIGYECIMTSKEALTGTDRVAEVAEIIDADIYINIQGDEPLVEQGAILKVREAKINHPDTVINCFSKILEEDDPQSVNIPKVIMNEKDELVYMSRSLIPGHKDLADAPIIYFKQVCIYAFNKNELLAFKGFGRKSFLEKCEDIEILRFLDLNKKVSLIEVSEVSFAVDVEDDIAKVEKALKRREDF